MMILGMWFGAWGAFNYGPYWGLLIGAIGGAIGGLLHAIATVGFGVDHIISGVAINILAPFAARFLSSEILLNIRVAQSHNPRVWKVPAILHCPSLQEDGEHLIY